MVSAVFHSPPPLPRFLPEPASLQVREAGLAMKPAANDTAPALGAAADNIPGRVPYDWRELWLRVLPPIVGIALLVLVWEAVSITGGGGIPSPRETLEQAITVFSNPFYSKGPNDQGVGWNVFSQLAWLPIGLLVFKGANPAAIWTIFICSIWPMIVNTAVGVQRVPSDYMNVARVLNLSEWKIASKILFPAVLPYMLTGVRLAVGTAWLVIVAAEMLTGGVGIGFWVWDEWNNLNVKNIIIAIFVIGIVGLVLEYALIPFGALDALTRARSGQRRCTALRRQKTRPAARDPDGARPWRYHPRRRYPGRRHPCRSLDQDAVAGANQRAGLWPPAAAARRHGTGGGAFARQVGVQLFQRDGTRNQRPADRHSRHRRGAPGIPANGAAMRHQLRLLPARTQTPGARVDGGRTGARISTCP